MILEMQTDMSFKIKIWMVLGNLNTFWATSTFVKSYDVKKMLLALKNFEIKMSFMRFWWVITGDRDIVET